MAGTAGKYLCTRHYNTNGGKCDERLVPGALIECITWNYIMGLITNPEHFEEKLREAQVLEAAQLQPKQQELDQVVALLRDTENEVEEIARVARKVKGNVGEKLQQQAIEVHRRYQALEAPKAKLRQELERELTDSTINDFFAFS